MPFLPTFKNLSNKQESFFTGTIKKDRIGYLHSAYLNKLCLLLFVAGSPLTLLPINLRRHESCTFLAFDNHFCSGSGWIRHEPFATWRVNVLGFFSIVPSSMLVIEPTFHMND